MIQNMWTFTFTTPNTHHTKYTPYMVHIHGYLINCQVEQECMLVDYLWLASSLL